MKNPFRSIRIFWSETLIELKKASWPSLRELRESTIVVLVAVLLLGGFIGIADFSLFQVVNLLTDWVSG
jgi:preprotein translocase subunit SecE